MPYTDNEQGFNLTAASTLASTDVCIVCQGSNPLAKATLTQVAAYVTTTTRQVYNVRAYGAVGDGTTDDTTAITAAWNASNKAGPLYIPPGFNCKYTGSGLNCAPDTKAVIYGEGRDLSQITLGSSSRLFDTATVLDYVEISGLWIEGGLGVFRSTFTGDNSIINQIYIHDCIFNNYTVCAIETNASDFAWIRIARCNFYGSSAETSMGIALTGWLDNLVIEDNSFWFNKVNIKLGATAGNGPTSNAVITRNNFMRAGVPAAGPRTDVWIVPNPNGYSLAGFNLIFDMNRFGNENLDTAVYRVIVADEGTGATNAARSPVLSADSTGYISGITFRNNGFYTEGTTIPLIYSTTPNVQSLWVDGFSNGFSPAHIIDFRTLPTAFSESDTNIFGPFNFAAQGTDVLPEAVSNSPGFGVLVDPANTGSGPDRPIVPAGGGDPTGYAALCIGPVSGYTGVSLAGSSPVTDALGGTDAIELQFNTGFGQLYHTIAHGLVNVARPAWIEFDVKQGSSSPVSQGFFRITDGGNEYFRRQVAVAADWVRYRYLWIPQQNSVDFIVSIESIGTAGTIQYGRVRIYHAREPLNVDGHTPGNWSVSGDLSVSGTIGGTTPVVAQAYRPSNVQTGTTYTFVLSDNGKKVTGSNSAATTWTIPLHASVAFPVNAEIDLAQLGTGQITIAATGGVTLNSYQSKVNLAGQFAGATLTQTATDVWLLVGNLT